MVWARERWLLLAVGLVGAMLAATAVLLLRGPAQSQAAPPAGPIVVDPLSTVDSPHPTVAPTGSPTTTKTTTSLAASTTTAPTTTSVAAPTTTPPTTSSQRTVPDVMYYADSVAIAEIRRADLVPQLNYVTTQNQCYVIDQSPAGGATLAAGQNVYLTVATNLGPCEVT